MSGSAIHRPLAALAAALAALAAAGCVKTADPTVSNAAIPCDAGKLGTHRTIELAQDSRPLLQQLAAKEVVLTFDDGPEPGRTQKVLDLLAEQCVQAAFFLMGEAAAKRPELVRTVALSGHALGGHGWAHANLVELPLEAAREDIVRSVAAIDDALAAAPETAEMKTRLFRFPYVQSNREVEAIVADLGLVPVTVHADGKDWELTDPEAIIDNVFKMLARANDRGVILLHDPFNSSARATELLLDRLNTEGYRIVAIKPAGE